MLYPLLRWMGGVALSWYYRDVQITGAEQVHPDAPLLIAANHPNQLVDVLLVTQALRRRVTFTGKAVLLDNPFTALVCRAVGFVPLRRASDERKRDPAAQVSRSRNQDAFAAIHDALVRREAVLIFPEGISHGQPELAPIKSGTARIALSARDVRCIHGIRIVPVGLTFERKFAPRSRVLVEVGAPLALDAWDVPENSWVGTERRSTPRATAGADAVGTTALARDAVGTTALAIETLTAELDRRLRAVTLNFPTTERAERVLGVARLLSEIGADDVRPLAGPDAPMPLVADLARRASAVLQALEGDEAPDETHLRAEAFVARADALRSSLDARRVAPGELMVSTGANHGLRFVVREALLALVVAPVAWWGRLNHWLPLALARRVAGRTSVNPEDPAMHTIVAGMGFVLAAYAVQGGLVAWLAGPWWALAYVASLPLAALWDFRARDRLARATARARAYLTFRRDPALQQRLQSEARWLLAEAAALEQQATTATTA